MKKNQIIASVISSCLIVGILAGVIIMIKNNNQTKYENLLGKVNEFPVVSENDKFSTSYKDGIWCKISDGVVKMVQYGEAFPNRSESILEYLNSQEEFNLDKATILALDGNGAEISFDLSTPFENIDVGEVYISYKLSNGGGISYLFYPDYIVTISEYLYYSDLESDENQNDSTENSTDVDFSEYFN